ncbi:ABC-type Na+ efflux pump permease subunit [Breznakia sp. PF5-3]|uniref:ABC transporter permease subunit n=1 Tax=unclassified Breznakia TaxID=2623764 RepID=UPI002405FCB6|nr:MULTISPECIES: ABC transporter permease subunit [unclassified Breznakia]MDF9825462.1 ABC-type Na+ efflux pump permease subunit [Breznakia sp. PM6-1]MDF9836347.1 ABC-type Na+ efflux pump permease subunit [Breznakia sp. PF5-3]MDF9838752.1 ABC-type Na+ efflux pump permease subunit [Breznakia sp. PFB2-8]MDF9860786.1 ABC-type Na+ efflux pump permease subunit [Breznakia sp. PH5-24]
MLNSIQRAIIKKDLRTIVFNKRLFPVLLIVPFVFSIALPSIFIVSISFLPESSPEFQQLLQIMPSIKAGSNIQITAITLLLNTVIPVFFILIPIMASSVMAASSFVGEKEKRTLETLLYSPISLKQIFQSKIFAALSLSMMVTFASFIAMVITVQLEMMFLMNHNISLDFLNWIIILIALAPTLSLLSITLIVNGSAKSQTVEESQQRSVFLIIPVFLLLVGQFSGIILINAWLLLIVALIFLILTILLMKRANKKFTYEALLKQS